MQTLDVGETALLRSTWHDGGGNAAEPSAITLTITKPDGTVLGPFNKAAMTQGTTTNVWIYAQVVDASGAWRYQFEGTVAGLTVKQEEQVFLVGVGSASRQGPCEPWTTWEEVTECLGDTDLSSVSESKRERIIDSVSGILYDLSGRFYQGMCVTTRDLCLACSTCAPTCCSCFPSQTIDLNLRAPVWAVIDITIDGVVLAPANYTLTGRRYLVRTDDLAWPRSTDLSDPTAFRARLVYGRTIPPGARQAASIFAAEVGKACAGLQCELPQRILTINREGITFGILDAQSFLAEGRTGIYLVDEWLTSDRRGRKARPGIFIPGGGGARSVGA